MNSDNSRDIQKKQLKDAIINLLENQYKILGSHQAIELIADDIIELEYKINLTKNNRTKKQQSLKNIKYKLITQNSKKYKILYLI